MRATAFYRPRFAGLTEKEGLFAEAGLDESYMRGGDDELPLFDFVASREASPLMTRRIGLWKRSGIRSRTTFQELSGTTCFF